VPGRAGRRVQELVPGRAGRRVQELVPGRAERRVQERVQELGERPGPGPGLAELPRSGAGTRAAAQTCRSRRRATPPCDPPASHRLRGSSHRLRDPGHRLRDPSRLLRHPTGHRRRRASRPPGRRAGRSPRRPSPCRDLGHRRRRTIVPSRSLGRRASRSATARRVTAWRRQRARRPCRLPRMLRSAGDWRPERWPARRPRRRASIGVGPHPPDGSLDGRKARIGCSCSDAPSLAHRSEAAARSHPSVCRRR
jgi:hypothetical protein